MMQLVNDDVQILNPPKDNLICDAAKVEEILGVPPERVIDIMALRGDAIDNIPGAPGIGDKGSVEIIKRFGTVEQALDRANEVEKKTYRESLQNNRDTILFSKSMATIDTNVPVELNVEAMRAGEPDLDLLRQLFTELEFTSLLKELLPEAQVTEAHYNEAQSAADVESVLNSVAQEGALAIAVEQAESILEDEEEVVEEEPQSGMLALTDEAPSHTTRARCPPHRHLRSRGLRSHGQTGFQRRSRQTTLSPRHRGHAQVSSRLQSRDPRARSPGHPSAGRASRSHALLLPARSHLFLASPRRRSPPPLQSQTKRRSSRSRRRNRQARGRSPRRRQTGRTDQALRRNRSPASPRSSPHGAGRSKNRHRRAGKNVNGTRNAKAAPKKKKSTTLPEPNSTSALPSNLPTSSSIA